MSNPDSNSANTCPEQKQKSQEIIHQLKNINMFSTKSIILISFRPEILALSRSGQELSAKNVRMTFLHKFRKYRL